MSKKLIIINGPNLNMLGERPAEIYGSESLEQILKKAKKHGKDKGIDIDCYQSNHEGDLIDTVQQAQKKYAGIIINPGGYSHTSVALRDALEIVSIPIIEVHLSNIFKREEYRKHSYVSEVASGVISGLGAKGYIVAIDALE